MSEDKVLQGEATAGQIAAWKREFGEIVEALADDCVAYFRKPTRAEVSYAQTLQGDPLKMAETLLKGCFVGGDELMFTDLDHLLGASAVVEQLITAKEVEVKKL